MRLESAGTAGAFLVRRKSTDTKQLVLSYISSTGIRHVAVTCVDGIFCLPCMGKSEIRADTVGELVSKLLDDASSPFKIPCPRSRTPLDTDVLQSQAVSQPVVVFERTHTSGSESEGSEIEI